MPWCWRTFAGLAPAYSPAAPERLNLRYVESGGKAFWLADALTRLPDALRAAANFSASPQQLGAVGRGYVAPAGEAHLVAPRVDVRRNAGAVTLDMDAPGDGFTLLVPREAGLEAVNVNGAAMPASSGGLAIGCATPDCGQAHMTLTVNSRAALSLTLLAQRRGLPPDGARLLAARPSSAVPSQAGDRSVQVVRIAVPAR